MIGAYAQLRKTCIKTPLQCRDCIIVLPRNNVIKQAFGGAKQKSKILVIPNQYKDILDDFVNSLNLEYLEMFFPNNQTEYNPIPNPGNKPADIETDLEKFRNILQ